jgi:4-oxalocrotonate tautomerase
MPHVIVKLLSGRTERQKQEAAEAIAQSVVATLNCSMDAISVAFEEVAADDWQEAVFKPDILAKQHDLYKKPGYDPRI